MTIRRNSVIIMLIYWLNILPVITGAQQSGLILQLKPGRTPMEVMPVEKKARQSSRLLSARLNTYAIPLASDSLAQQWAAKLRKHPQVVSVATDRPLQFRRLPNDPQVERQWALEQIRAPEVWDITTGGITAGGDTIVVAVIDSGFDPAHPDLRENIWQNRAEIPDDDQDNDRNGLIDDQNGWNFAEDSPVQYLDPHGQSVAGIIGATGNNELGVSGINWQVKVMLFSVRKVSHVVAAMDYILTQRERYNQSRGKEGALVVAVNTSLGLDRTFCDDQPTWRDMYELLGAEGVLSAASPPNVNLNVDVEGDLPTSCTTDFLITSLRTDQEDQKPNNSGFGRQSIDLGAPGEQILTTGLNGSYNNFSGTSASSPHLAGAIALLYSLPCPAIAENALSNPATTALQIKSALLNGIDPVPALEAITQTGGRLNLQNSADILLSTCASQGDKLILHKLWPNPTRGAVTIDYQLENTAGGSLEIYNSLGQLCFRQRLYPTGPLTGSRYVELPALPGGIYFLTLTAGDKRVTQRLVYY